MGLGKARRAIMVPMVGSSITRGFLRVRASISRTASARLRISDQFFDQTSSLQGQVGQQAAEFGWIGAGHGGTFLGLGSLSMTL